MPDDRVVRRRDVAFAHGVLQLERHRIHAELVRSLVHLDVERVIGLHHAVAAVGAGDRRVRIDTAPFEMDVVAAIKRG